MILKWSLFCLLGSSWQCLEIMFVSQLGSATGILQVQDREAAQHPTTRRKVTPLNNNNINTKNYLAQMSIVLRLRNPVLWLHDKMKTKIVGLKESNVHDTIILF